MPTNISTHVQAYKHTHTDTHNCIFINVKGFRLLQHYLINPICGASEKNRNIYRQNPNKNQSEERKKNYNQFNYFYEIVFFCVYFFFVLPFVFNTLFLAGTTKNLNKIV